MDLWIGESDDGMYVVENLDAPPDSSPEVAFLFETSDYDEALKFKQDYEKKFSSEQSLPKLVARQRQRKREYSRGR